MKPQKKYNIFSNIAFALKNVWMWDRLFYVLFFVSVPVSFLLSFLKIYFPKVLLDTIENDCGIGMIIGMVIVYFAFIAIMTLVRLFCDAKISARKYSISHRYENEIWNKYMRTDFSNTDSPVENIKFQNALSDATSNCSGEAIIYSLLELLKSILSIVTYGTLIAKLSPLVVVLLSFSALTTYQVGRWQRMAMEKDKEQITSLDRKIQYLSNLSSDFDYAKEIRIFDLTQWIGNMLKKLHNERLFWHKKNLVRSLCGKVIAAVLMIIRDGAAYAVLTYMLFSNRIETGDFIFLFGAITSLSSALNAISNKINDVISRGVKIGYYREYFDICDHYNHGVGCELPSPEVGPLSISFKNVSYKYPSDDTERVALDNVTLTISPGEKIAIVGPNGAGKTTFIKLLCGLYSPTSGDILVNEKNIKEYNIEQYYSLFSIVFQDLYLLPITIEKFISSCDEEPNDQKVDAVLLQSGLAEKIAMLPNGKKTHLVKGIYNDSIELSGGETQKLMFARALYKDAPIVILDEPTAALDPIAENNLYLQYSMLTKGKTSIYISHRLSSTRFCDRIIYMESGKIVEAGSHDELIRRTGKYAAMYELQSRYYKENVT